MLVLIWSEVEEHGTRKIAFYLQRSYHYSELSRIACGEAVRTRADTSGRSHFHCKL